ncbi:MAG: tRNA uridine-5-carboxymethylaminomethyl(34) synthesis GTPase MnmE [Alistipes sp.]|nr:tRNA uridine-5-carboxymethylaminomethyl(34) synthesis GTPase MnmE [Alistipes sp.]
MITDSHDTIAAPATATGGAIALIRVSGPHALVCCDRIFKGSVRLADAHPNTIHYGHIVDGEREIDDVLMSVFRAPHSYTGEDSAEISVHGSRYIVAEVLRLLSRCGVRMAAPGEFTVRAFLAGKMDLSQAEAVADMIAADSKAAHALASTQMKGGYSSSLHELRQQLLDAAALLELELDFSEEDVEFADRTQLAAMLDNISAEVQRLASSFHTGNALKEGVAVAIVGKPNVGKSTLLNRLTGEERAITSEIAGTTRDTIEESCDIDGVRFRFIDTAGIRETDDKLERMGIERTRKAIADARIIVSINESGTEAESVDIKEGQTVIEVINKSDLADVNSDMTENDRLRISALTGDGIEELRMRLRAVIDTDGAYTGETIVTNSRHFDALQRASASLTAARSALDSGLSGELLSEELREVLNILGEITGEVTSDDILQNIFSRFCIGK